MKKSKNIVIIGASGHAKVVIDIIEQSNCFNIIGIIDSILTKGDQFLGYPILGNDDVLKSVFAENPDSELIIAVGDNWVRSKIKNKIVALIPNIKFATIIHPTAIIANEVEIGQGTVIMPGVIVNRGVRIGEFAILNTRSSIDHDCRIGNFSSVAPNVTIGGGVAIGEYSAVSIGAVIRHSITIGSHTIVGASSLVLKDFGNNLVVYGSPATTVRERKEGEKYL